MHMALVERRLNTPAAPARAVITAGAALSTSYERAAGLFLDGKPCSELHLLLLLLLLRSRRVGHDVPSVRLEEDAAAT